MRPFLLAISLCAANAVAQAQTPSPLPATFPASRPASGPNFDFPAWLKAANTVDHDTWNKRHPEPFNGWFSPDNDECARNYVITWGPLGIRTLMHDRTHGGMRAFRRAWPAALCDTKGELILDCFEVIDVIPGAPAEGRLQKGDLLVAMDGAVFRTGLTLRPDQPLWKFQSERSLEMDAGERLDAAEGRGRVSFDVIRPKGNTSAANFEPLKEALVTEELAKDGTEEINLDIPITGGNELTLALELTGDGNGHCHAQLIQPRLESPQGTLDLTKLRRLSERTGWGKIRQGVDNDGNPITYQGKEVPESIWLHAPGHLTWPVPEGCTRFRATLVRSNPEASGYRAKITLRTTPQKLPESLAAAHQVISFDIPKIGSFGRGFPNQGDAKSALIAKMTAAWLAGQQQQDGSWKRTCGYTNSGYDTAWAGLGLLAQADPAYNAHIRKAAEFIAFKCPQDGWAVPNAMMVTFLAEYWLRTKDNRVLIPLQSQVERIQNEMIYADWVSGHGHNPGYRGTGVSIGGSHVTLALAIANLTPIKVEPRLIDGMLARAQELGPDGYIPYGRDTHTRKFEPRLEEGGTYSGRHGPYLIASLIHGGPRLFTQNCVSLYTKGAIGGIDQGHATQTLALSWALLASAMVSPETLERQIAPMRWKFAMLRCFDGGFCQNAYRLEYQGGEGLLPNYLRSGAYLVMLNASKRNMALTGAPQWRAKSYPNLPALCHDDAVALSYYQRNWGVVLALLQSKAPSALRDGVKRLLAMGKTANTRTELFDFLKATAPDVARQILALSGFDQMQRQYLAEMVLGVDIRVSVETERKDDKEIPGHWTASVDAQYPLAGWMQGATDEEKKDWKANPAITMEGSVEIVEPGGKAFAGLPPFTFARDAGDGGWQTRELKATTAGPERGPLPLVARIRYKAGDLTFSYDRPVTAGGEEAGNGEKGRKLLGDRVVWVLGRLIRDLDGWSAAFTLPSGQYISAATQGVSAAVFRGNQQSVAPQDGTIPARTLCEFGFSSGWHPWEARIAAIRVKDQLEASSAKIETEGAELNQGLLSDFNRATSEKVAFPTAADAPLMLTATLPAATKVRGIDLRLKNADDLRMTIEAERKDQWQLVFQGRPGDRSSTFQPVEASRLRVTLTRLRQVKEIEVQEFRVIRTEAERIAIPDAGPSVKGDAPSQSAR